MKIWKFKLDKDFQIDLARFGINHADVVFTCVSVGCEFFEGFIRDNKLHILKGYAWDGCTPKFRLLGKIVGVPDFKETWRASLVHDFLIEYCRQHSIPRKTIDEIFEVILKEDQFKLERIWSTSVHLFRPLSRKLGGCY